MTTLYVTDLDGTLLRDDLTVSPYAVRRLTEWIEAGVPITVATARSLVSARHLLRDIPLHLPMICFDGGFISDPRSGRHLHHTHLDDAVARGAFDVLRDAGLEAMVSTTGSSGDGLFVGPPQNDGQAFYLDGRVAEADPRLRRGDPARGLDESVMLLTAIGERERLEAARAALHEAFELTLQLYENRYQPGWWWLSIHPTEANKGAALRTLRTDPDLGLAHVQRVVAFGDAHNDVQLLREADLGLAVANATDEAKAAADGVIGANGEDAVVRFIEAELG